MKRKILYVLSCVFILVQSCITIKKGIDLNKIEVKNPNPYLKETLKGLNDDSISVDGYMELRKFIYKDTLSDGKVITINNKSQNRIAFNLKELNLASSKQYNKFWISPNANKVSFKIEKPIPVQYNKLKSKLVGLDYNVHKKILTLVIKSNLFALFGKKPKKIKPTITKISETIHSLNLKGETDLMNVTDNFDKLLLDKGNLGDWSKRAYWLGNTKVISASGNSISIKTKLRAEAWVDGGFLGKHRLWQHDATANIKLSISIDNYGKGNIEIKSIKFKYFPEYLENILVSKINEEIKNYGLDLNPKGLTTKIRTLEFQKINSKSLRILFNVEVD